MTKDQPLPFNIYIIMHNINLYIMMQNILINLFAESRYNISNNGFKWQYSKMTNLY